MYRTTEAQARWVAYALSGSFFQKQKLSERKYNFSSIILQIFTSSSFHHFADIYLMKVLPFADIYFKQKKAGGLKFTATTNLTSMNERNVYMILNEYKIFNAEVIFR